MSCDDLKRSLSSGEPVSAAAVARHLEMCSGCGAMTEALRPSAEQPRDQLLESITGSLTSALQPVRPLPSNGVMISLSMGLFVAFSVLMAALFGYDGFQNLTAGERLAYYAVILMCAAGFSVVTVQEMIPGSEQRTVPAFVVAGSILALALISAVLFPRFDLNRFVRLGIPCLRLGVACAAVSGFLAVPLLRKGFFTSPLRASSTTGSFAGLTGVAVLALHCPIKNTSHIVVWHAGAMVIGGLAGAVLPAVRGRFGSKRS